MAGIIKEEINPRRGEVYRIEIIDAQGYEQKGDDDGVRLAAVEFRIISKMPKRMSLLLFPFPVR